MMGLILISLTFFLLIFILTKGKLAMIVVSLLIFGLSLVSGYYWFQYGLRVKENDNSYFIENRYGVYQNYSDTELQRTLELESKKHAENKWWMNLSAILFIVCIAGLAVQAILISLSPGKFSRMDE